MRSQSFVITGMTCANCVNTVSKALNASDHVSEATVNLATEKAKVLADDQLSDQEIIRLVEAAGYGAIVNDKAHQEKIAQEAKKREKRLYFSLVGSVILTLPLLFEMILHVFQWHIPGLTFLSNPIFQLVLATPVQFIVGARFYVGAYHALKNKSANMDVLVALGTSVAYFSSLILSVLMGKANALNFESSMVIITLVVMGKVLEHRAKEKTTDAITSLMSARATTVHRLSGDVAIEAIKKGEKIRILAGEKVPLDVKILSGTASFDESHLTGEDLPVVKSAGDALFEGGINLDSEIIAQVVHDLNDSTISRMVEMMSEAQSAKPNIQKMADRISNIFVPIVLIIALLTFAITWWVSGVLLTAIMHAVATLVIACPCALGLATPTAIISGTGLAAKYGLLIKNANALELAQTIKTIFFDKTGTITTGKFELIAFDGNQKALETLYLLESRSNHPLAKSLTKTVSAERFHLTATDKTLLTRVSVSTDSLQNVTEIAGRGVTATIDGQQFYAGNQKLMQDLGLDVPESKDTVIYLANEKQWLATATFGSTIKPEAIDTIQQLKKRKIKTVMLTGDNAHSAQKIQSYVHLDEIKAGLAPEEKAQMIQKTPDAMMVGDGINDAIALASSSVGVAMATGSDIAMEAGDVTVIGGKLNKITTLLDVSDKTMRKIKQNYFWAFFYNVIGIPLAAFGLLNPMLAAAAMSLSSVSVILNSLLLTKTHLK